MSDSSAIKKNIQKTEILKCISTLFNLIDKKYTNYTIFDETEKLNNHSFEICLNTKSQWYIWKKIRKISIFNCVDQLFIDLITITFYKNADGKEEININHTKMLDIAHEWTMDTDQMDWPWLECQLKMITIKNI